MDVQSIPSQETREFDIESCEQQTSSRCLASLPGACCAGCLGPCATLALPATARNGVQRPRPPASARLRLV